MKLRKAESLILQFITASFVGWVYEIAATCLIYGRYYDRGVLHLPLCPIYGFGALGLAVLFKNVRSGPYIFLGGTIATAIFELLSAYGLEYVFHLTLWTYEGWPLNFQNRISLVSSMIFGILAVIFLKCVKPGVEVFCRKSSPLKLHILVTVILLACVALEIRSYL